MSLAAPAARRTGTPPLPRAAVLAALVLVASVVRAALNGHSSAGAFIAGSAFGLALIGLALAGGWRPGRLTVRAAVIGLAGGMVLVAIPVVVHGTPLPIGMRPEPMLAWLLGTLLVAVAEEAVLRGALFAELLAFGPVAAVLITSVLFAIIHVPLYGWAVVPIDFAAGIWLAGLRLASGGVAAPAIAHVLADLATWWL